MFIISKLFLPLMHSLGHSNYSNSVHRLISRVLSSSTPREGIKIVQERFSNRTGKPGGNIFKDRRVEFRIRILKQLLSNLGPHMNTGNIKKINQVIDIKEKLYHHVRKSHGVTIRSGVHNSRSDEADYNLLLENLNQTQAHIQLKGRKFGNLKYPSNIMEAEMLNKAAFYRWLTQKNRAFASAHDAAGAGFALPGATTSEMRDNDSTDEIAESLLS